MDQGDSPIYTGPYSLRTAEGVGVSDGARRELQKKLAFGLNQARRLGYANVHIPAERGSLLTGERYLIQWKIDNSIIIPQVTLFPATEIQPEIETCTNLLSGLADIWDNNGKDGVETLRRFYPRAALGDYLSVWWNPATEQYEELYPGWNTELFEDSYNSFLDRIPGRFSGLMRTVVQDMLGRGAPVSYDYRYNRTHGIYVSSLTGEHWVVEITKNHVAAWPIQKCEDGSPHEYIAGLDYIPAAYNREGLDADGIIVYLTSSTNTNISEAYQGNFGLRAPYCNELGWAFSYDGHEASNVVYEDRNRTDNPATGGLVYSYSYLFTLTITEDPVTGAPSIYTLTEVESDWLYGNRETQLKYPDYNNQGLMSFDWWRVHPTPPYAPGSPDGLYAPVYCYYVDTQLKVIRYTNSYEAKKTSYDTGSIPPINPAPYQNGEPATTKYGTGEEAINYKNGFETPEYTTQAGSKSTGSYVRWFKSTYCYDAIIIMEETQSDNPTHAQDSWSQWYHETKTNHTENAGAPIEVLVIPFNDRESYFLHTSVDSTTSSHLRSLTNGTFFRPVGAQGYIGPCGAGRPYSTSTNHNAWSYNGLGIPNVALQEYQYFDNSYSATTFNSYPFPNGAYVWMPKELMNNGLTGEWCVYFVYDTLASSAAEAGQKWCDLPWHNRIFEGLTSTNPKCGTGESSYGIRYRLTPGGTIFTELQTPVSGPLLDLSHVGGMRTQWLADYGQFTDQSVAESGTATYDIIGFVDGNVRPMEIADATSLADWSRYIDDPANDQQWMMAVVDNSGAIAPIYTPNIAPDQITQPGGLLWPGQPLRYPYNEIESINACWVGNPQEP